MVDPHVRLRASDAADALAPITGFIAGTGECHVLRAVHVQPDLAPDRALADVARVQLMADTPGSGGLPNGIVACADLTHVDGETWLDALARHARVRGVRPWRRGRDAPAPLPAPERLDALARLGLTLELDGCVARADAVAALARSRPGCPIVVVDGGPSAGAGAVALSRWRAGLDTLARFDNVALKLCGEARADEALRCVLDAAIGRFGAERVMLAGSFGDERPPRAYDASWRAFARAAAGVTPRQRDGLFRSNAVRVYRL